MKNFRIAIKVIASIAVCGMRLYFGPVGALSGAIDGIVYYAIWFNNAN